MKKIILCMALSFLCLVGAVGSFLINDSIHYGRAAWGQMSRMADRLDDRWDRRCDPRPVPPRERGHQKNGLPSRRRSRSGPLQQLRKPPLTPHRLLQSPQRLLLRLRDLSYNFFIKEVLS